MIFRRKRFLEISNNHQHEYRLALKMAAALSVGLATSCFSNVVVAFEQCQVGLDRHGPYGYRAWNGSQYVWVYHSTLAETRAALSAQLHSWAPGCGSWTYTPYSEDPNEYWYRGLPGGYFSAESCPRSSYTAIYPSVTENCVCPPGLKKIEGYCVDESKDAGEPECPNAVGNPINVAVGNKVQVEPDYISPVNGISFSRIYNSDGITRKSHMGSGWTHSYDRFLSFPSSSKTIVQREDGKLYSFNLLSGAWRSDADVASSLTKLEENLGWEYVNSAKGEVEKFDSMGRLISITSRTGYSQVFAYSDGTPSGGFYLDEEGEITTVPLLAGLLIEVTDSFGYNISLEYNSDNLVVVMNAPGGGVYRYTYAGVGVEKNLISVEFPNEDVRAYVYNESVNTSGENLPSALTGIIDEKNNRYATFQYNSLGRAISTEHAGGVERISITYMTDNDGVVISSAAESASNLVRQFEISRINNVAKTIGVDRFCPGCSESYSQSYDASGNLLSLTNYRGHVTSYSYSQGRNLEATRTEAEGSTSERLIVTTWHPEFHLPLTITEPGKTTTFSYDTNGNLLSKSESVVQ